MTEFKTPLLIWLPWKHWKPQKCRPVLIIPKGLNHAYVIPGTTSTSTFEEDSVCVNMENAQDESTKPTHFIPKEGVKYCIKCLNRLIVNHYPQGEYESNSYNPEELDLDLDKIIDMIPADLQNDCVCPLQEGDTIFHKKLKLFGVVMEVINGKIRWIILDDAKKEGEKIAPNAANNFSEELYFYGFSRQQFNRNDFEKIGKLDWMVNIKLRTIAKKRKFFG